MDASFMPTAVGIVAGLFSTYSFVPQLLKVWRQGDCEAISKRMYLVTVTAFSLWITYGVLIDSLPVMLFNSLSLLLSGSILLMKLRHDRRAKAGGATTGLAKAPATGT
ncbi:SemiSWEET transporter [Aerophototrophica crusticola]|uniref:SemiSWEET transporter n=1 Tax=Aerophototrophica crusticola TaxID=1709002 RepID=A0A858R682_9PROT|nr:SemiSWEET transporter [Rhodospirillaceae bacterium B3]